MTDKTPTVVTDEHVGGNAPLVADMAAAISKRLEQLTAWLAEDRERLEQREQELANLKGEQAAHALTNPGLAADMGKEIDLVEALLAAQRAVVASQEQQRTMLLARLRA